MCLKEFDQVLKTGDGNEEKKMCVMLNCRKQYVKSSEGTIQIETMEGHTAQGIKKTFSSGTIMCVISPKVLLPKHPLFSCILRFSCGSLLDYSGFFLMAFL